MNAVESILKGLRMFLFSRRAVDGLMKLLHTHFTEFLCAFDLIPAVDDVREGLGPDRKSRVLWGDLLKDHGRLYG